MLLVEVLATCFPSLCLRNITCTGCLLQTNDLALPTHIPTALCHVVGFLSPAESLQREFAIALSSRIKDANSCPTVPWDDTFADFQNGQPANFTGAKYRPPDDNDDEVEKVHPNIPTPVGLKKNTCQEAKG